MAEPGRQLVLDLPVEPRFGMEDFLVGASNRDAFAAVDAWPAWPSPFLHLIGPPGSGKSHLAAIWADRSHARASLARTIGEEAVPDLASAPAIVVEDLDSGPLDEPALFHLLNLAREHRISVLLTSAAPIEACGIRTPDLLSRLRLAPSITLGPPDDELLKAVLVKLFADRQLAVDTSVVEFAALRIERSFARAAEIVAELDREALSRGRRVTRPIASEVIGRHTDAVD